MVELFEIFGIIVFEYLDCFVGVSSGDYMIVIGSGEEVVDERFFV